ncbi:AlpA family transcriptional regulator [Mesorhizobium sp. M0340]
MNDINDQTQSRGFIRLKAIVGPNGLIPISRSSWYQRVSSGEFPSPVRLGPRTTAWRAEDIHALIDKLSRIKSV